MRLSAAIAFMAAAACVPAPGDQAPARVVQPAPLVTSVERSAAVTTNPPVLLLGHKWALGRVTALEVRRRGEDYILNSKLSFCQAGRSRVITESNDRAELARLLPLLDPRRLSEADPCHESGRDGTVWMVAAGALERARPFGMVKDRVCAEFEEAAHSLMRLAGITCRGVGCFRTTKTPLEELACP